MSWNGSQLGYSTANKPKKNASPSSGIRPSFVLLILVVIVAGCVVLFLNKDKFATLITDEEYTNRNLIVDGKHSKFGKGKSVAITTRKADVTREIERPEFTDENPIVKQKVKGRVVKWVHRDGPPVFTNRFEAIVCEIMMAEPGERFLDFDIEEDYDEAFEESLLTPIVINVEDSEYVKDMKRVVIDAKEEVRKLALQGQTPHEILTNARDELNKIADYRDELQEAYNKFLLKSTSVEEALRFAKEANELLAEYGALPIDGPEDEEESDLAEEMLIGAKEARIQELDASIESKKVYEDEAE